MNTDEQTIRLLVFIGVLASCAILEALFPRKQRSQPRLTRWFSNLSIIVIDSVVVRFLGQLTALATAAWAAEQGWGILNWDLSLSIPTVLAIALAVILLDGSVYFQHVLSHKIPILWRFHRVHHADRDIDVTTGTRFHPIEIVLSMIYKCFIVLLLGPSVFAVFLFEVILNASAMFNHSNLRLPLCVDRCIRWLIVTPDMHRVHHSTYQCETDSNYGFFLSVWDRGFKTYIPQPKEGHDDMVIGLAEYQDAKPSTLLWCLKLPFQK